MQVRDLMISAAKAQEQVLAIPAPSVLFAEFGDWSIKFNLICFVDDIERAERTRSDINFEVLRRMREAGLRIAYPAPPPADVPSKIRAGDEAGPAASGAAEVGSLRAAEGASPAPQSHGMALMVSAPCSLNHTSPSPTIAAPSPGLTKRS